MATQDTQFGDSDSHVLFTPKDLVPNADHCKNISNHECTGRWWQEGIPGTYAGSVKATWGRGTTFEITFYGSGITVLGVKNSDGGKGTFTMDGEAQSTTTDFHADSLKLNQTVYNRDGLDLSNPHTLHFRYFDASFKKSSDGQRSVVRFDSFLVQHPADVQPFPSVPLSSPPIVSLPATNQPSETSSVSSISSSTAPVMTSAPTTVASASRTTSAVVPVVAGLVTGFATLVIAGSLIFFFLRRRRAVRVQSMSPPARSSAGPTSPTSPTAGGRSPRNFMSLATYAFTRRGSSVTSSADSPPRPVSGPPPPVPQITQYVSPYNYHRPVTYPHSDASTSLGPPVDERPPNIPQPPPVPLSPARAAPRVLRVYNPDSRSAVSSNYSGG